MSQYATGGMIPPHKPDGDHIPVLLSPCLSTFIRPGEANVEAMARLLEGADLEPSPMCGPEPERGPDRFGRRWFAPAPRRPWWRRLMWWRP